MLLRPRCMVVLFLITSPAVAADREFSYSQKTGALTLDGKAVGTGYSGHGEGKDDPSKEDQMNVGPIPAGLWTIGGAFQHASKGPTVMRLTPVGHSARGRDGFLIHGDNPKLDGAASDGCIILDAATRKRIAESGVTRLRVVRE